MLIIGKQQMRVLCKNNLLNIIQKFILLELGTLFLNEQKIRLSTVLKVGSETSIFWKSIKSTARSPLELRQLNTWNRKG